ncbi:B12-binding domain-containing protein [Phycisphaerales bacterium AB-hyl4]|uniref:B12-binding domain-containing protein n=1 Tax=Natronomicrosphaera hydrolytica TaxID=3242702 RepID=A0ABV4U470_9BACT
MKRNRQQLADDLTRMQHELARTAVVSQDATTGDLLQTPGRLQARREDVTAHLRHLAQAVAVEEPRLLQEYVRWTASQKAARSQPLDVWRHDLDRLTTLLANAWAEDRFAVIKPYLEQSAIDARTPEPEALSKLARQYLDALLTGQPDTAAALIHRALDDGMAMIDIYLDIFQRTQREIGRLWEINRLSVAEEHYCTAATQSIMAALYPRLINQAPRVGRTFVAACVESDLHELGLRMVADCFELAGWTTHYLGANLSHDQLLEAAHTYTPDVFGLGASMSSHVQAVAGAITRLRCDPPASRMKIIVGGNPFNLAPDLWQKVGADGYASDARQAIAVAEQLASTSTPEPACEVKI